MTASKATVLLEHYLKQLKLPTFLREYGKIGVGLPGGAGDYQTYLLRLASGS